MNPIRPDLGMLFRQVKFFMFLFLSLLVCAGILSGTPQDIQATGKDACTVATTGCSLDAAILVTLPPGAYTAIVRGVSGGTGVGLVGIDEIGP